MTADIHEATRKTKSIVVIILYFMSLFHLKRTTVRSLAEVRVYRAFQTTLVRCVRFSNKLKSMAPFAPATAPAVGAARISDT